MDCADMRRAAERLAPDIETLPKLPELDVLASRVGPAYDAAVRLLRGPTPRSNWICPGKILCGDRASLQMAREICAAGVTTFVSLQQKHESAPYHDGITKHNARAKFLSLPIADQQTTGDAQVSSMVQEILRRVASGEVIYVHCRGGHGRTGTLCSLLLGALYRLDGPTALLCYQAMHDTREQPVFAARHSTAPSDPTQTKDMLATCVALFHVQKKQVIRLLDPSPLVSAHAPEAADASVEPPAVDRSLSDVYGRGASKYDAQVLSEWKACGQGAGEAARRLEWDAACAGFEECVRLRPDWEKGHACLARAREKAEAANAAAALPAPPATLPAPLLESSTVAAASAPLDTRVPSVVVLVGLPGAGKSTFASALAKSSTEWLVVDSDEVGGKRATEAALRDACKVIPGKSGDNAKRDGGSSASPCRLIVDRCHVTSADRADLLELLRGEVASLKQPTGRSQRSSPTVVYFATSVAACVERVSGRTDHPTIPYGKGRPAIESMAKALELPPAVKVSAEGGGGEGGGGGGGVIEAEGLRWLIVRSPSEVDALLRSWGAPPLLAPPIGFFKFPRTRHVLNTGGSAVTRDDLVMEDALAGRFFDGTSTVVAEEKVDGANLGLSLTASYEIRVQNRSHYVTSQSHAQFRSLDSWLAEHSWAVCALLVPEDEVLFGEWCAAQHSRAYSRLPGVFLAFDIYNKRTRTFASAAERDRRLAGLGIPIVRTLARRPFTSKADLLSLLEMRSAYGDGFVEGAYLRIDSGEEMADAGVNVLRGKIVRPDFIQGMEEHWASGEIVKNGVRPDLWMDEVDLA